MRPATTFAARFIGTPPMNVVRLAPGRDGAVLRGTDGPVVVRGAMRDLLLGLRPEAIRLADHGASARVVDGEFLGADTLLRVAVGDETLAVRVSGRAPVVTGATTRITWAPDDVHLFDPVTGRRTDDAAIATVSILG